MKPFACFSEACNQSGNSRLTQLHEGDKPVCTACSSPDHMTPLAIIHLLEKKGDKWATVCGATAPRHATSTRAAATCPECLSKSPPESP